MTTHAKLNLAGAVTKADIFARVEKYLSELNLGYTSVDSERPWGGFFVIDEAQTAAFIAEYFPDYDQGQIAQFGNKLSPKILVVGPGMNLSWQYHDRRAELWKTVVGPVGYKRSLTDEQGETQLLQNGETVQFDPSERHRLMGLDSWGIVAEIWQHTDPTNPSEESDIVRLADDFGR